MKSLIVVLGTLFSLNVWSASSACEQMQLQFSGSSNVDFATNPAQSVSLTVKADTTAAGCDFFITVDYGTGNTSYSNRFLKNSSYTWPYQLANDSAGNQILKTLSDAQSSSDVVTGTLSAGSNDRQVTVNFWALLSQSNLWLPAGNYTDSNVTIRLYKGSFSKSNTTVIDSRQMSLNYNAPKRADISVVPTNTSFDSNTTEQTLDFGTLSTGATQACDVILKYNSGYRLYAQSDNNGKLKHTVLTDTIPYTVRFANTQITMNGQVEVSWASNTASPASGYVIPVSIVIGTVPTDAKSGSYSDRITLTVQAN